MNANPFADETDSSPAFFAVATANPYAPPCAVRTGEYDHSLFWRVVKACLSIAVVLAITDAFLIASVQGTNSRSRSLQSFAHTTIGNLIEDPRVTTERIRQELRER